MKLRIGLIASFAAVLSLPVFAEEKPTSEALVSTTTISASTLIAPGRYRVSIAPNFNSAMAGRLEKALGNVAGLKNVKANHGDATIVFSVKENATVPLSELQQVVKKVDNGAVMTVPVLEGSLATHLGS